MEYTLSCKLDIDLFLIADVGFLYIFPNVLMELVVLILVDIMINNDILEGVREI